MKKISRVAILCAFIVTVLAACSQPKPPEYRGLNNLRILDIGAGESMISADLLYYNQNGLKMRLKSGEMKVYLNDRFLGTTLLDTLVKVPPHDTFSIPVSMKIKMSQLYSNALDILLNKEVRIKLDGYARVGQFGTSFNLPIHYEGVQKLDIHL